MLSSYMPKIGRLSSSWLRISGVGLKIAPIMNETRITQRWYFISLRGDNGLNRFISSKMSGIWNNSAAANRYVVTNAK